MLTDKLFKDLKDKGYHPVKHTRYHVQVRKGGFIFNIYPTHQKLYINGSKAGIFFDSKENLFAIIDRKQEIVITNAKDHRKSSYKKSRRKLWTRGVRHCFICGKEFANFEETTLDHKIPLGIGGADRFDNYALACSECNKNKGANFTKPSKVKS